MKSGIEILKELRKERGLTQVKLAKMIGKHNQSISNIEMGLAIPHKSTVAKICIALELEEGRANELKTAFNADRTDKRNRKRLQRGNN